MTNESKSFELPRRAQRSPRQGWTGPSKLIVRTAIFALLGAALGQGFAASAEPERRSYSLSVPASDLREALIESIRARPAMPPAEQPVEPTARTFVAPAEKTLHAPAPAFPSQDGTPRAQQRAGQPDIAPLRSFAAEPATPLWAPLDK